MWDPRASISEGIPGIVMFYQPNLSWMRVLIMCVFFTDTLATGPLPEGIAERLRQLRGESVRTGFFPYGFKRESYELFKLSWPLSLSILFHYMIQPISLAFCGHLGQTQLAAVAMALSVIYITTVSFGRGLAFGGDTYFSQTYGSPNKKMMGVYLQRGLLFGVLTSFPIWGVLLNVQTLLLLLGQNPEIARLAQEYCLLFMPGVLAYCWLFLLMRYLLCQNRVIPNFLICVSACGVNALLHYGLLFQADMGIKGSAIALATTYYLVLALFIAYIWGSGIYRETWDGWSWKCLEDWGPFGRTVVASIIMTFIFWLCTEAGTFLSGILGEKELSAFSIMFQVEGFVWMIPLGLGGACAARVGQYLGANEPLGAVTSCRVAFTIQIFISIICAALTLGLKHYIPQMFTTDKDIVDYTEQLIPILALFLLLEGFGGMCVSVVRGTGRQTMGAIVLFVSYYVFALPIGIPLMFCTYLGQAGIWWGYVIGIGLEDLFLMGFLSRMDWDNEAHMAQIRAGITVTDPQSNLNEETDERSRLLPPVPEADHGTINGSTSEDSVTVVTPTTSRVRLVLSRLGILLIFVLVLVVAILVRMFVDITPPDKWTELCIPVNETYTVTWFSNHTTVTPNTTLPFCNDTLTAYSFHAVHYMPIP